MLKDSMVPPKAEAADFLGRFREVISDPLNVLIERVPLAGVVHDNDVYLLNGNRVPISGKDAYYGSFSQLLVVNRGVHEPLEEFVFQELIRRLPPAPQMIELGAYWAHYSMWLKKLRPQANVIMVESDPDCLAAGRNNFARNGFVGEFIQAAVSRNAWQVDQFLNSRAIDHLDILHVDIQGFEVEMMAGARETLASACIDYLFVSTHSQQDHHEIVASFKRCGYRIEVTSDFDNETTSYDGLVFASSPRAKSLFDGFVTIGRAARATSSPDGVLSALERVRRSTAR
jgi:Methyltransferase FkbM domain